jgi:hypothetical protein
MQLTNYYGVWKIINPKVRLLIGVNLRERISVFAEPLNAKRELKQVSLFATYEIFHDDFDSLPIWDKGRLYTKTSIYH